MKRKRRKVEEGDREVGADEERINVRKRPRTSGIGTGSISNDLNTLKSRLLLHEVYNATLSAKSNVSLQTEKEMDSKNGLSTFSTKSKAKLMTNFFKISTPVQTQNLKDINFKNETDRVNGQPHFSKSPAPSPEIIHTDIRSFTDEKYLKTFKFQQIGSKLPLEEDKLSNSPCKSKLSSSKNNEKLAKTSTSLTKTSKTSKNITKT